MFWKKRKFQSKKFQEKRKKKLYIQVTIGVVGFAVLLYGVSFWSRHPSMKVTDISVEGATYVRADDVSARVLNHLAGAHIGLFSKSNTFFVPQGEIEDDLVESYDSIISARAKRSGLHGLRIRLTEHEPIALWCEQPEQIEDIVEETLLPLPETTNDTDENVSDSSDENADAETDQNHDAETVTTTVTRVTHVWDDCYYINDSGFIFAHLLPDDMNMWVKYTGALAEGDPVGQTFSEPDYVSALNQFVRLLDSELAVDVSHVVSFDGQTYIIYADDGQQFLIDINDNLNSTFTNLETLFEQDAINDAQFGNIEYIDLRFGNRVYYKLR